jgi:hypothetical protein
MHPVICTGLVSSGSFITACAEAYDPKKSHTATHNHPAFCFLNIPTILFEVVHLRAAARFCRGNSKN